VYSCEQCGWRCTEHDVPGSEYAGQNCGRRLTDIQSGFQFICDFPMTRVEIRPPQSTFQRLEEWIYAHKARRVDISHDDGYGTSTWEVYLACENSQDLPRWRPRHDGQDGYSSGTISSIEFGDLTRAEPAPNIVYVRDDADGNPPGLEAVILAALKRAEELGFAPHSECREH